VIDDEKIASRYILSIVYVLVSDLSTDYADRGWQFVTNHTQVLLCIARDPDARLRDIADAVGVTLGSAQRILADLVEAGYVHRERHGRRNRYVINREAPMRRHAAQQGHDIGRLLDLLRLEERD
jgi:DNA-binding MarR family transcriptional regulator